LNVFQVTYPPISFSEFINLSEKKSSSVTLVPIK